MADNENQYATVHTGDIVEINGKDYEIKGYAPLSNGENVIVYSEPWKNSFGYIDSNNNFQKISGNVGGDANNPKFKINGEITGIKLSHTVNGFSFEPSKNDQAYLTQKHNESVELKDQEMKNAISNLAALISECEKSKDNITEYANTMNDSISNLRDGDKVSTIRIEELIAKLKKFKSDLEEVYNLTKDFVEDKDAAQNNWQNKAKWYENYYGSDPKEVGRYAMPTDPTLEKSKWYENYYGGNPEDVGRMAMLNTPGVIAARNMVSDDEEEDVSDDESSDYDNTPSGYPTGGGTTTSSTEAPTEKPTVPPTDKRDNPFEKPTVPPTEKPTEKPTERPTEVITQPTTPPTSAPTTPPTEAPKPTPSGNGENNNGGGNSNGNGGNWYTGGNSNNNNSSSSTTNVEKPTEVPTVADDVIKKGNTYKLPTSSKPVTTTTTTTSNKGNSAIPVLAGLAAAAAAGIGAKAYIDRKNNRDNDENEEFKAEDWSNNTDVNIEYQEPQSQKEETLDFDDNGYEQEETEKYGARTHQELEDLQ